MAQLEQTARKCENLVSLIEKAASDVGSSPLYSFLNRSCNNMESFTFEETLHNALSVSLHLDELVSKKTNIIIYFPHGPEFIFSFFGCILGGYIPVPITKPRGGYWGYIHRIVEDCNATCILTRRASIDILKNSTGPNKISMLAYEDIDFSQKRNRVLNYFPKPSDTAFIQYTSGSVTAPKGVVIEHQQILDNLAKIKSNFAISKQDKTLSWLPFHHDMGLIGHVIQPIYSQVENVFMSPSAFMLNPLMWLKAIAKYRATISGAPNFAYELIATKLESEDYLAEIDDLSCWRLAYCGAETIQPLTASRFIKASARLGVAPASFYTCYGLAESTLFVCGAHGLHTAQDDKGVSHVSVGNLYETSGVTVVDQNSNACPEGETGEIIVSNGSVSPGYFKDIANSDPISANNVLRTGDAGFIKDSKLYIVGRLNNRFKIRGRSFFSEDIEAVAMETAPPGLFSKAVAFVVDAEAIKVVLTLGTSNTTIGAETILTLNQIQAAVQRVLDLVLDEIVVVPEIMIPLTTSGKPRRAACSAEYKENKLKPLYKLNINYQ